MAPTKDKASAPPESGSFFHGLKGFLAKIWPLLVALVILAYLFARVPRAALWEALAGGPWLWLGAYVVLVVLLALLADAYATCVSLRVLGLKPQFSLIVLVRGATYLLGLLSYSLGQGALGFYLQRCGLTTFRAAGIVLFLLIVNFGLLLIMSGLGLWAGALPGFPGLSFLALGLAAGMLAYLSVVSLRPQFLQGWRLLAPLLEAGWAAISRRRGENAPRLDPGPHLLGSAAPLGNLGPLAPGIGADPRNPLPQRPADYARGSGNLPGRDGPITQSLRAAGQPRGPGCRSPGFQSGLSISGTRHPGYPGPLVLPENPRYRFFVFLPERKSVRVRANLQLCRYLACGSQQAEASLKTIPWPFRSHRQRLPSLRTFLASAGAIGDNSLGVPIWLRI